MKGRNAIFYLDNMSARILAHSLSQIHNMLIHNTCHEHITDEQICTFLQRKENMNGDLTYFVQRILEFEQILFVRSSWAFSKVDLPERGAEPQFIIEIKHTFSSNKIMLMLKRCITWPFLPMEQDPDSFRWPPYLL
jgi:hypothetical protein